MNGSIAPLEYLSEYFKMARHTPIIIDKSLPKEELSKPKKNFR
jgi:hypothetical protein